MGTDIDPVALASAKAHSALDAHPIEIQLSAAAPDHWGTHFDLVVANILEAPLRDLAPALSRALRVGGALVISGFTRPQAPALRMLYKRLGLTFASESRLEEWALLMFERTAAHGQLTPPFQPGSVRPAGSPSGAAIPGGPTT
jgi:ribosomal protein L11 methyltransferase